MNSLYLAFACHVAVLFAIPSVLQAQEKDCGPWEFDCILKSVETTHTADGVVLLDSLSKQGFIRLSNRRESEGDATCTECFDISTVTTVVDRVAINQPIELIYSMDSDTDSLLLELAGLAQMQSNKCKWVFGAPTSLSIFLRMLSKLLVDESVGLEEGSYDGDVYVGTAGHVPVAVSVDFLRALVMLGGMTLYRVGEHELALRAPQENIWRRVVRSLDTNIQYETGNVYTSKVGLVWGTEVRWKSERDVEREVGRSR